MVFKKQIAPAIYGSVKEKFMEKETFHRMLVYNRKKVVLKVKEKGTSIEERSNKNFNKRIYLDIRFITHSNIWGS